MTPLLLTLPRSPTAPHVTTGTRTWACWSHSGQLVLAMHQRRPLHRVSWERYSGMVQAFRRCDCLSGAYPAVGEQTCTELLQIREIKLLLKHQACVTTTRLRQAAIGEQAQTWVGGYSAGEVVGLCRQQDVPVALLGLQSCRPGLCQGQDGLGLAAPAPRSLLSVWQTNTKHRCSVNLRSLHHPQSFNATAPVYLTCFL